MNVLIVSWVDDVEPYVEVFAENNLKQAKDTFKKIAKEMGCKHPAKALENCYYDKGGGEYVQIAYKTVIPMEQNYIEKE